MQINCELKYRIFNLTNLFLLSNSKAKCTARVTKIHSRSKLKEFVYFAEFHENYCLKNKLNASKQRCGYLVSNTWTSRVFGGVEQAWLRNKLQDCGNFRVLFTRTSRYLNIFSERSIKFKRKQKKWANTNVWNELANRGQTGNKAVSSANY